MWVVAGESPTPWTKSCCGGRRRNKWSRRRGTIKDECAWREHTPFRCWAPDWPQFDYCASHKQPRLVWQSAHSRRCNSDSVQTMCDVQNVCVCVCSHCIRKYINATRTVCVLGEREKPFRGYLRKVRGKHPPSYSTKAARDLCHRKRNVRFVHMWWAGEVRVCLA